ncbi:MAG: transposase, partial [Bdellovibrionales bacterium]|nr:transposase [Bdellovibrionales bacterium]
SAKSIKSGLDIDWRDATSRAAGISGLARAAIERVRYVRRSMGLARRGKRKRIQKMCKQLQRVVAENFEQSPRGEWLLAKKVAKGRLCSLTDPQASHGRKSKNRPFTGFKLHLLGDSQSGLLLSSSVTSANVHDGQLAERLIRRGLSMYEPLDRVFGDTAYAGAKLRHNLQLLGVTPLTPAAPETLSATQFATMDFGVDLARLRAVCPAGVATDDSYLRPATSDDVPARVFRWSCSDCQRCPISELCLKQSKRKVLELHPYEKELRETRDAWSDEAFRALYKRRSEFERLINETVRHGGRQARAFGLASANLQAELIVAANNLRLLSRHYVTAAA